MNRGIQIRTPATFVRAEAFTLVELFVVIAVIIGLLTAVTLPGVLRRTGLARRVACQNNLKQMGASSQMYAEMSSDGAYANTKDIADDDLIWLYPDYIWELKTYICPSTRNYLRHDATNHKGELQDLMRSGPDKSSPGHSYEVFGYFRATNIAASDDTNGVRKTRISVQNREHTGPAKTWIILDCAKRQKAGEELWLKDRSNHGEAGVNVVYCDGHVEFVTQAEYGAKSELSEN